VCCKSRKKTAVLWKIIFVTLSFLKTVFSIPTPICRGPARTRPLSAVGHHRLRRQARRLQHLPTSRWTREVHHLRSSPLESNQPSREWITLFNSCSWDRGILSVNIWTQICWTKKVSFFNTLIPIVVGPLLWLGLLVLDLQTPAGCPPTSRGTSASSASTQWPPYSAISSWLYALQELLKCYARRTTPLASLGRRWLSKGGPLLSTASPTLRSGMPPATGSWPPYTFLSTTPFQYAS